MIIGQKPGVNSHVTRRLSGRAGIQPPVRYNFVGRFYYILLEYPVLSEKDQHLHFDCRSDPADILEAFRLVWSPAQDPEETLCFQISDLWTVVHGVVIIPGC